MVNTPISINAVPTGINESGACVLVGVGRAVVGGTVIIVVTVVGIVVTVVGGGLVTLMNSGFVREFSPSSLVTFSETV